MIDFSSFFLHFWTRQPVEQRRVLLRERLTVVLTDDRLIAGVAECLPSSALPSFYVFCAELRKGLPDGVR